MTRTLRAKSPTLPRCEVLLVSLASNSRLIRVPRSANWLYLDYRDGACVRCNHPLRDGRCPKHGAL